MANIRTEFTLSETKDFALLEDARKLLNLLWNLPIDKRYVPCPNPSNLERKDLPTIHCEEYVVSPKLDGMRMFLLIGSMETNEKTYSVFINRSFQVFPLRLKSRYEEVFEGTLLDGEMTTLPSGQFTFTVFDAVTAEGYDLKSAPFLQRKDAYEGVIQHFSAPRGLQIVPKQWFPRAEALKVFAEHSNVCDGLILQPVNGKLKAGIQSDVFKWKSTKNQTIDFYISVRDRDIYLECGNGPDIINASHVHCHYDDQVNPTFVFSYTRQVFECALNRVQDNQLYFVPLKPRLDKVYANDSRVILSTLKSIQDDIIVEELCD
jgi:hypothetical protein